MFQQQGRVIPKPADTGTIEPCKCLFFTLRQDGYFYMDFGDLLCVHVHASQPYRLLWRSGVLIPCQEYIGANSYGSCRSSKLEPTPPKKKKKKTTQHNKFKKKKI
jgi:hypothetical protein